MEHYAKSTGAWIVTVSENPSTNAVKRHHSNIQADVQHQSLYETSTMRPESRWRFHLLLCIFAYYAGVKPSRRTIDPTLVLRVRYMFVTAISIRST